MVRKKPLQSEQKRMSPAAFVDQAAAWSADLVSRESRGPGDTEGAMRRIGARYGLPYSLLWGLRYRRPKSMEVSLFALIHSVYVAEIDRQQRLLAHDREITTAKTWIGSAVLGAVDRLAGQDSSAVRE